MTEPVPPVAGDDDDDYEAREAFINSLADRTTFQLHYSRSPMPRRFSSAGLNGPPIDNAYDSGMPASGDWCREELNYGDLTEERVFSEFFSTAVNEAVHEALEWFRIDGRTALDPHGTHETRIFKAVDRLAAELWAMVMDRPEYALTVRVNSDYPEPVHIRKVGYEGLTQANDRPGGTLCNLPLTKGWDLRAFSGDTTPDPDHGSVCADCLATWKSATETVPPASAQ